MSPLSRRDFLTAGVAAGAGLVIGFYLPHGSSSSNGKDAFAPNAYLKIAPDGKITVTVARSDVHYVVTEYGVAYLHGRSIRERAQALVGIADPAFREELCRYARERLGIQV